MKMLEGPAPSGPRSLVAVLGRFFVEVENDNENDFQDRERKKRWQP